MKIFDARAYSVADFIEWQNNQQLELSPNFQRRSVWPEKAKSYLVDTILRGKPIPKVLITQEFKNNRTFRIVVDGQQRLRAIFDFLADGFRVSRAHNRDYAGLVFSALDEEVQQAFREYELGVDVLYNVEYSDLLDIFARINTYTIKLNTQEKLNAKYLGYFKQTAYELGHRHVSYFLDSNILTPAQVTRMAEAELASDLLGLLCDGIQSKKILESLYEKYEEEPGPVYESSEKFDNTMAKLNQIYKADNLRLTNWRRVHLFYTLFSVVAHGLFGVSRFNAQRPPMDDASVTAIRVRLDDISQRFDEYTNRAFGGEVPRNFGTFIDQSRRATTDLSTRTGRAEFLCDMLTK